MTTDVCEKPCELTESPSRTVDTRHAPRWLRGVSGDALWLVVGQGGIAVAQLGGVRLLTEIVPPEVYGLVGIGTGIAVLGRSVFFLPFALAALRQYSDAVRQDTVGTLRNAVKTWMNRSGWLVSVLAVFAGIGLCVIRRSASPWLVGLVLGLVLVDGRMILESAFLSAARRHKSYAILRASEAWLRLVLALVIVGCVGASAESIVAGYVLASLVLVMVMAYQSPRGGDNKAEFVDRVWRFSLPLIPIALLEWITGLSDRYIVGGMIGLEAAGVYTAAYGLISQPFLQAQMVLENYFRPPYYEAVNEGDTQRAQRAFFAWLLTAVGVCVFGVVAVGMFKAMVVDVFLAAKYRNALPLMVPVAVGNAVFVLSNLVERVLHARERTHLGLIPRIVGAVASVAVTVPLVARYGLFGAAWAAPIYYTLQFVVTAGVVFATIERRSESRIIHVA